MSLTVSLAPRRDLRDTRARVMMRASKALIYTLLILIALVEAFPLVWMLMTSVKNQREVFGTFLPTSLDFTNFGRVWVTFNLPTHLLNSLYVTTLTVGIVVVVSTLAGYAFARYSFRGRDLLFYVFIGAMMIPGQAILIPMFQFLKSIGLLNTLTGLSLS
jgi:ABC-type glycerol-3-phosphate transport system permease component